MRPISRAMQLCASALVALLFFVAVPPTSAHAGTGGSISGTVTFVGNGEKNLYVNVWRQEVGGVFSAIPDAVTGKYSITGLPAGKYKIQFATTGNSVFAPQWWKSSSAGTNSSTSEGASVVSISDNSLEITKDAVIRVGASIAGKVSADGLGLANVQIQAINQAAPNTNGSYFSTNTDSSGNYKLQGLPPGSYKIEFRPNNGSQFVSQFWGGAATSENASIISFSSGQNLVGKNVALTKGGTLSGKVMLNGRTSGVKDIPITLVSAINPVGGPTSYTSSQADGQFSLTGVRPGKYKILFDTPYAGQQYLRTWWTSGVTTYESASTIDVAAGQVITDLGAMVSPVTSVIKAPAPQVTVSTANGATTTSWTKPVVSEPIIGYNVGGMEVTTQGGAGGGSRILGSNTLSVTGKIDPSQVPRHSISMVSAVTASGIGIPGVFASNPAGVELLDPPTIITSLVTDKTLSVTATAPTSSIPINDWAFKIFGNDSLNTSPTVTGCNAIQNQSPGKITCTFTGLQPGVSYSVYAIASQNGQGKTTKWGKLLNQTTKATSTLSAQTTGTVSITGTSKIGSTLTASTTGWSSGVEFAYEWFREGNEKYPIAITKTYVPSNSDAGKKLFVRITSFKNGVRTVSTQSVLSAPLSGGQMTGTVQQPVITGGQLPNPLIGDTLTAAWSGGWPSANGFAPTQTFKWLRDGVQISTPVNAMSYQLVAADVGHKISFAVVFSAPGFDDKKVTSSDSAPVLAIKVGPGMSLTSPKYTTQTQPPAGSCVYRWTQTQDPLPDATCTPGSTNPAVTQSTISSTICVSGYTDTIRPSSSITSKEKTANALSYSFTMNLGDAEYDHLIPLELGGDPNDPKNLWVQPQSPGDNSWHNPKDPIETKLKKAVCNGTISLWQAQYAIATNWTTALASLGIN